MKSINIAEQQFRQVNFDFRNFETGTVYMQFAFSPNIDFNMISPKIEHNTKKYIQALNNTFPLSRILIYHTNSQLVKILATT